MNTGVIILAIVCIWPSDATQEPKVFAAPLPTMDICKAATADLRAKLGVDPAVRFVSTSCVELDRGSKA